MWIRSGTFDLMVRTTSPEEERTLTLGRRIERLEVVGLIGPSTELIESDTGGGVL